MNRVLEQSVLLAQQTRLDSLSRGLQGRPVRAADIVILGLALAALVVLACLVSYFLKLHERRRSYSSRRLLFVSLCRAHRLRLSEGWLLWRVARARGMGNPARLFLEPELLEANNLDKRLRARARVLKRLRQKLFAEAENEQGLGGGPPTKAEEVVRAGNPMPPAAAPPALDVVPWPLASEPISDLPLADQ
jgi:hypothetical protein